MPAIRAKSASVVSMPPRERRLAKRRARAAKLGLGLPPSVAGHSPNKTTRKEAKGPVPLTLAATRERRAGANRAYLVRPDGIHIKRVEHRPAPEPVPHVPYLPGQEDIPHSDDESNESNNFDHTIPNASIAAEHHILDHTFDVADEADDLLDYDAEGEDDDEHADTNMDMDINGFSISGGLDRSNSSSWYCPSPNQPVDLLANASKDDIQALFSGFNSLRFDKEAASLGQTDYFPADFSAFDPPVLHIWNNADGGSGIRSQAYGAQEPLAAHQVNTNATTNNSCTPGSLEIPPLPAPNSALPHPPLPPLRRVPTPAPWIMTPEVEFPTPLQPSSIIHVPCSQPTPLPSVRQATPRASASRAGTPVGRSIPSRRSWVSARPRPQTSTSKRASRIRGEAQPLVSHRPPLSPSLASPANFDPFLTESDNEDGNSDGESDSNVPRASTPVELGDTDIGLTESSVLPAHLTQPQCRAARWINLRTPRPAPRSVGQNPPNVPTHLELRANAQEHYAAIRHKTRVRGPIPTGQPSNGHGPLRSFELTDDQRMVMGPMEHHVYKDIVCINPWPRDRDAFLEDAHVYSVQMTGKDGAEIYTQRFMDTVYSKMSANRGETLAKIEVLVQQELAISAVNKPEINMYLDKHNFLYPTIDRDEHQKFRVHIIGSALLVILFECGKQLGLVFMEEFNQPDDARKCADWHGRARDRTARSRGIPPGLIAYTATQIHWALLKLQKGGAVHFQEIQFRAVWTQYLRALLKLKHLGELRMDLLELVRNRYVENWPGAEQDNDDDEEDSYPAW
ncbi:hypothetical protein RhiJN_10725 [Ceratobasidium sp. AG-Ba]|nr:hypothetical protein RhiJN_10720 [Ceratobasidium sp. AG-Ba]QRV82710.1 hypothetical protein RhiJN_10725 [Ceratobasidium sp. AG-Ba]